MPKRNGWQAVLDRYKHVPRAIADAGAPRQPVSPIKAADGEATIYVYDEIAWYGVDANQLVRDIAALDVETIHVRINSPGGDVFGGVAIYNALRRHPANVVCHVDGLAASAASFIALAGDRVLMGTGSFLMIHNAWAVAIGPASTMRETADTLDKIDDSLVGIYASRTEKEADEIRAMMEAETWMDADEAVEEGFADATEDGNEASARASVPTERDAEKALRDAGFSAKAAKAIVASGFKATPEPRDEDGGELAALIRGHTELVEAYTILT